MSTPWLGQLLYGPTAGGGNYGRGTVYVMKRDGGEFRILHQFGPNTVWTPLPSPPVLNNGQWEVSVPIEEHSNFFRLAP
jgi:uncharacterized repeat protein (TIGR03803 family)